MTAPRKHHVFENVRQFPLGSCLAGVAAVILLTGCGGSSDTTLSPDDAAVTSSANGVASATSSTSASGVATSSTATADYPNVLSVELSAAGDNDYSLSVTMSSEYDSPERYADGWRVLDADGNELGNWTLGHDHASEQPFTRTQTGLEIPDGVTEVTVEGRDQKNGYGGATVTIPVPQS